EIGVMNSQDEIGVVNSQNEIGVMNSQDEIGVMNSQDEIGVVNSRNGKREVKSQMKLIGERRIWNDCDEHISEVLIGELA
ncbi:MAG: hypothetical protein EZS28_043699, partial [Streblomastix strix]